MPIELVKKNSNLDLTTPKIIGGGGGAVNSVNGMIGNVVLTAADVGAVSSVNGESGDIIITAATIGALPDTTEIPVVDWDIMKNKPFGEDQFVFTFDGNTDGKEELFIANSQLNKKFYKVSDKIFTAEQLEGAYLIENGSKLILGSGLAIMTGSTYIVNSNTHPMGIKYVIVLEEGKLENWTNPNMYSNNVTAGVYLPIGVTEFGTQEMVRQIEDKYIADNIVRDSELDKYMLKSEVPEVEIPDNLATTDYVDTAITAALGNIGIAEEGVY